MTQYIDIILDGWTADSPGEMYKSAKTELLLTVVTQKQNIKNKSQYNRRTRGHNLRRHLRKVAVTFVCHPEITVRAIFLVLCTVYCYVLYISIII